MSQPLPHRFTLVQKLIVSYAAITFCTLGALIIAILGLYSVNRVAREIARGDLVFISSITQLRESLVAQESYASKYAIVGGAEFAELFRGREQEFLRLFEKMAKQRPETIMAILANDYQSFRTSAAGVFAGEKGDLTILRAASSRVLERIDTLNADARQQLNAKLASADRREESVVRWTMLLSFAGFILAIGIATFFSIRFSSAVTKLKQATHRIAAGEFDYDPNIPSGDEFGELAQDFSKMAGRLKELEQISLDASPLTRLPGNIAIEQVLNRRLQANESFAFCYADLDNFKAYNDRYGYVKGSELIKWTGEMVHRAATGLGGADTFVGHVGGDDFIVVTDARAAEPICQAIIAEFDREIGSFYTPEDVARGAIEGVDRYGVQRVFPLMTISIAVVYCRRNEFDSAMEIAMTAAQIKDHVKGMPGSHLLVNRRKVKR